VCMHKDIHTKVSKNERREKEEISTNGSNEIISDDCSIDFYIKRVTK
jgi:hypothetical protein